MSSYDPKKATIRFGTLRLTGFSDDDKIAVAYDGEGAKAEVGSDGDAVLIDSHDKRATITVSLMRTGPGRQTLSALLAFFNAGNLSLPIAIVSLDTGEVLAAGEAKMKNPPDIAFNTSMPKCELVFVCGNLKAQTAFDTALPFQGLL